MINLNLPIRRLVAGAILLATWGGVTPSPSQGRGGQAGDGSSKAGCFDADGNRIVRTTFPDGSEGVVNGINFANMGCFTSFVPIVVTPAKASAEWNSPVQAPVVRVTATSNPTVGVSPSTIDENFRGFVQVSLDGLATGDSVRLEKFQVNNNTGSIDAGAILEQSFLLTDGVSNQIGGVANVNVPADNTPADGAIAAQIPFLDSSVPVTVGEYVFRFSSPTSSFSALTARLTVSNVPDAQDISGQVTANAAPVPNAYVILLDTHGGSYDFIAGTIADGTGHYSFGAAAGQYDMVAVHRGFVGAFGRGVEQTLAAGEHKVVNLTMEAGTRTISGQVRDTNTSAGLPGVQVVFRTESGKFTVDYTDASGNFSTSVTPDKWNVEVDRNAVNQIGYLAPFAAVAVDASAGNASNINLSLAKATTLLYGTVKDSANTPLAGLDLIGTDETYRFQAFTVTDNSGNYVIAISSGVWAVDASASALGLLQDLAPLPTKLYAAEGQAARVDFAASKASAHLSGALKDNNGAGISDITYKALRDTGRLTYFGTEADGTFSVGLSAGVWSFAPLPDSAAHADLIFVSPLAITLTDAQTLTGVMFQALQPTHHVNVTVKDQNGTPRPRIELALGYALNNQVFVSFAYTDEHGMASLPAYDHAWGLAGDPENLAASGFREFAVQTITVSGSDVSATVTLEPLPPTGNTLVNLSTRGTVQTGDNVLIGGFIVPGLEPKKVLLRAIGPSLANFGVNGALSDPTLTLFNGTGVQIGFNDDWVTSPDMQAITNTGLAPGNTKESAIIASLLPGNYTAKVAGTNNATGVGLIELYDLNSFSSSTLANIATRGRINQGENVLIAGYIVGGYKAQRVVVRAIGPSLTQFGVNDALADPFLDLHNAQGTIIMSNNDWQDSQGQELMDTGIPPSNPKESALVTNLTPGNYTAVVSGVAGATGVGLAEVYNVTKTRLGRRSENASLRSQTAILETGRARPEIS
jgi:hypothetical protein